MYRVIEYIGLWYVQGGALKVDNIISINICFLKHGRIRHTGLIVCYRIRG